MTMVLDNKITFHKKLRDDSDWPREVDMVLSALEAGQFSQQAQRRVRVRLRYRVRAELRLFSDAPHTPGWTLYTRDVEPRSLGFVTRHRLPLGYGGQVELPDPSGQSVLIPCTLLRCRSTAPGWYEGAVYFNREQEVFLK